MKGLVKKKKKGIWDEVVQKANGGLEGNVKQVWQGNSGMAKNTAQGGDTGVVTFRRANGGLASNGKRKREILAGHYKRLGVPSENEALVKCLRRRWTHGRRTTKRHRR